MAYVVKMKAPEISFFINGTEYKVDSSDERLTVFNQKYNKLLTEVNEHKANLLENEDKYKDFVAEVTDELLGAGTFDKLYAEIPSIIILFDAINQIVDKLMLAMLKRVEVKEITKTAETTNPVKKKKLFGGK